MAGRISLPHAIPHANHVVQSIPAYSSLINCITPPSADKGKRTQRVYCNIANQQHKSQGTGQMQAENIVIVGAGIAGLATALSLHRLGVKSLVLEQADTLRTGGTSLTLFKNGWRVLDVLGVAEELRREFSELLGWNTCNGSCILLNVFLLIKEIGPCRMQIQSNDGRILRSFQFQGEVKSQEVRGVERRALLESLASRMPPGTIQFGSHVTTIDRTQKGQIKIELDDGTQLLTKVLIGCDGVRSVVAKWMGFSEPQYVGHCAFRGLGVYSSGHPFEQKVNYIYGKGLRAGYVPLTSTKVYWFVCFNSPSPGPKITDPYTLKKEVLQLVQNWPKELLETIENTPDGAVVRNPLVDRWLWPVVSPKSAVHGVTLAGDAWHPMTPNLGQGACCALEDAVILARKLVKALDGTRGSEDSILVSADKSENSQLSRNTSDNFQDSEISSHIDAALQAYTSERWPRIFPLTIRANLVGSLLQWDNEFICAIRNNIFIPKVVQLEPLLEHTNYDCGLLHSSS